MSKQCWTPGCDSPELWIPICAPPVDPDYARKRRCRECCNLIGPLASAAVPDGGNWPDARVEISDILSMTKEQLEGEE